MTIFLFSQPIILSDNAVICIKQLIHENHCQSFILCKNVYALTWFRKRTQHEVGFDFVDFIKFACPTQQLQGSVQVGLPPSNELHYGLDKLLTLKLPIGLTVSLHDSVSGVSALTVVPFLMLQADEIDLYFQQPIKNKR